MSSRKLYIDKCRLALDVWFPLSGQSLAPRGSAAKGAMLSGLVESVQPETRYKETARLEMPKGLVAKKIPIAGRVTAMPGRIANCAQQPSPFREQVSTPDKDRPFISLITVEQVVHCQWQIEHISERDPRRSWPHRNIDSAF